jgi:adenylate cyclase
MRRWLIACTIGFVTAMFGAGIALSPLGEELEKNVGLPWLFSIRGPIEAPADIVVVGINEASGRRMGLPDRPRDWPRSIHGLLVRSLTEAGATVIAFDVAFTTDKSPDPDRAFAREIATSKRVVLIQLLTGKRQAVTDRAGRNTGFVWMEQLISPIPILAEAARGLAPWPLPKQQASVHQFWSFKPSAGDAPTLPSLVLQLHADTKLERWRDSMLELGMDIAKLGGPAGEAWRNPPEVRSGMSTLRQAFRDNPMLTGRIEDVLRSSRGGDLSVRQKNLFRALAGLYAGDDNRFLNFYGPPGSIKTIPYEVMIKGGDANYPPKSLDVRGKIVFIGHSDLDDPGQPDRFYTVFTRDDGVDLSGVEIAATALGNLLQNRTLRQSDVPTTFVAVLLFGLLIGLLAYLLPAIFAVPTALVLAGLYAVGVQHEFNSAAHWLPLANPMLVQLPLALLLGLLGQYFLERRQQRLVRATMARYVDPAVTDRLIAGGVDVLGGRETTATVLFSDVRGFTTLSEALGPQATVGLLNEYFTLMVECITAEGGMLDKFMGDAIMAAFGVPVEHDDDADRAVRASIAMLGRLEEWNTERAARGEAPVSIGIGLNTDRILSGNIGSPKRMDYTLIGDGVNVAARLESATKQYAAKILISEQTRERLTGTYHTRDVDDVIVQGKTEPVRVHEVLDYHTEESFPNLHEVVARFQEGRQMFAAGRWDDAIAAFRAALVLHPKDRLSEIYIERCTYMKANPPGDWDGIWRLETK